MEAHLLSPFLEKLSKEIGLNYFDGYVYGIINEQIVSLSQKGNVYEVAFWVNNSARVDAEILVKKLNGSSKFFRRVDFDGHYIKFRFFCWHISSKKIGRTLRETINKISSRLQSFNHVTISNENLVIYDGYPGPAEKSYFELLKSERKNLLENEPINVFKAFKEVFIKRGIIVIITSVIFSLIYVQFKISVLPIELLYLFLIFNYSFNKRLNKINIFSKFINLSIFLFILLLHLFISYQTFSLHQFGEFSSLNQYIDMISKNFIEMNRGLMISLALILPVIFLEPNTKAEIQVTRPY